MPQGQARDNLAYKALLILLILVALIHMASFFRTRKIAEPPRFVHVLGYYTHSPKLGVVRVIPLAPSRFTSPVAASADPGLLGTVGTDGAPTQNTPPY